MKKQKSKITEEIIEFNGIVYNTKFINYSTTGEVLSIDNLPSSKLFLEIDINLIPNFINGNKDYRKYNIDYFKKIAEGLLTDYDDCGAIVQSDYVFSKILDNNNFDILITHNKNLSLWTVNFLNQLEVENLSFFTVLKSNKSFVLGSYHLNKSEKDKQIFSFKSVLENDFEKIDVLTYNRPRHYSIRKEK